MCLVSTGFAIGGAEHCLIAARAYDVRPKDLGVFNRVEYFPRKPLLLHFLDCVDVAETAPLGSVQQALPDRELISQQIVSQEQHT